MYGWSVVIGVFCAGGASSARTKATRLPLVFGGSNTKNSEFSVPAASAENLLGSPDCGCLGRRF